MSLAPGLGDKFSLREWHNMALTAGTLPLDLSSDDDPSDR
jgi:uncharacterized protein (DUF885 family)